MKKLLLPFMVMLFAISCKKEESSNLMLSDEIASKSAKNKKIDVCHYDETTGQSKTISISENAWPAHEAHGDLLGDCSEVLVTICGKDWMKKNLDVSTYRNGDIIPQVTDPNEWINLTTGAWCYQNNDPANGAIYGKLYNWHAVNDPRGIAPKGWHVPSKEEFIALGECADAIPPFDSGDKLKSPGTIEAGTGLWLGGYYDYNEISINATGFTGLPAGSRGGSNTAELINSGEFSGAGGNTAWWSSTEGNSTIPEPGDLNFAWSHGLNAIDNGFVPFFWDKKFGYSVRLIRN